MGHYEPFHLKNHKFCDKDERIRIVSELKSKINQKENILIFEWNRLKIQGRFLIHPFKKWKYFSADTHSVYSYHTQALRQDAIVEGETREVVNHHSWCGCCTWVTLLAWNQKWESPDSEYQLAKKYCLWHGIEKNSND